MEHEEQHRERLLADEKAHAEEREQLIRAGLDAAWRRGQRIDDLTAKRIARQLDPGIGPLHEFAETGAIPEGIEAELAAAAGVLEGLGQEPYLPRITALGEYLDGRPIRTEMPYWNDESME
jgi:hypothetical protein